MQRLDDDRPNHGVTTGYLVARDDELAAAVRSVRLGRGVVVVGEPGVGKTAFAASVAASAATTEQPDVVWIVATAASQLTPFGALGPLLPPEAGTAHPAMVPGLVLRRLQERGRPVLVVVDDAQLLDAHSAAAVLTLATGGAARFVVTVRAGAPASDAVVALWKDRLLDRLDLAPLDRAATRALLLHRLGGVLAEATVELLWRTSRGNPLYLTELVRYGVETRRLAVVAGVWWWTGAASETAMPPRLRELLQRRLDELSPAALDALQVLAAGEPLPYDTLAAVASTDAVLELEERELIVSDERDGVVLVRFAHPLLYAAAARRLTPARRRGLARRLREVRTDGVDLVRRAMWEEAAGDPPDVPLLLAAADAVLLSDPELAARFAGRAMDADDGPAAALALADAHAELGRPDRARAVLDEAAALVRDDRDRLAVGFDDLSLTLWSERRPAGAHAVLRDLRERLPAGFADEVDSADALLHLFTARTGDALRIADAVLARGPAAGAAIRALTVRVMALTLADRAADSLATAQALLTELAGHRVIAYRAALAHAAIAFAQLFNRPEADLPRAHGSSGRWPTLATVDDTGRGPSWALLEGVSQHVRGDWPAATAALREASVQQRIGEGLFRSEAFAGLVVVLAESGRAEEAATVLAEHPADDVAAVPGLLPWARAAVAFAAGRCTEAGACALAAADAALGAGAVSTGLWYLADASRWGGPGAATAATRRLDALPDFAAPHRSQLCLARAAGVRARAADDPRSLFEAAQWHARLGVLGHAAELAERAACRFGERDRRARSRAMALAAEARAHLGQPAAATGTDPVALTAPLTRRELEVARMAADGLRDQDIAASLVVSARTVESHLASAYRKLGIRSRRELRGALATLSGRGQASSIAR